MNVDVNDSSSFRFNPLPQSIPKEPNQKIRGPAFRRISKSQTPNTMARGKTARPINSKFVEDNSLVTDECEKIKIPLIDMSQ